ncbi:BlaI/MecI/CopY family transcriptional regulator [Streptomyces albireticuli]|uniref:CopY family transcriptional regulator n=1 Tax=Streptomyces albireticuli TaxID=1940 RepID=A0A2A2DDC4_9ACTN|nr:BlaI/MecI/CopY family transcriptional regulator [Streptomyces albireticuli]MCD9140616.1 BlaI/MecI/CopY family transcriptional regulator [Streptomyces albireticuli]MCD9161422.1 BlaI/MecI/CopY family transcriptional regulator [Streptomyces albireticuli]MCD9193008.1 BlaI/MecI/CopY family transcriptional regulator [Streptomyces albireticuli]PAU49515.1 CopY family transcriptional regulator [Streptomyces albireticuli]
METATPAAVLPRHGRRRANGALEGEVLAALQRAEGPLTPREVQARLAGELTYSTVVTILSRLHGKEVLTRTPRGRAYAYAPVTDEAGLAARRMRKILDGVPDREVVLARFVAELPATDEELLRALLVGAFPAPRQPLL